MQVNRRQKIIILFGRCAFFSSLLCFVNLSSYSGRALFRRPVSWV